MILNNRTKEKLQQDKAVIGMMLRFHDPAIAEMIAMSGVDYVCIDNEHMPFDDESVVNIVRSCNLHDVPCLIRPTRNTPEEIGRYLDMGCLGILAAHIETRDEAETVVSAVKFPPHGTRGFCPISRAAAYGMDFSAAEFAELSNRNTMVVLMVETKKGIENLEQIISVPHLDALVIGPSDLASSYGYPGKSDAEEVQKIIADARKIILDKGLVYGSVAYSPEEAHEQAAKGYKYINVGSDLQMIAAAARSFVEKYRKLRSEYESE